MNTFVGFKQTAYSLTHSHCTFFFRKDKRGLHLFLRRKWIVYLIITDCINYCFCCKVLLCENISCFSNMKLCLFPLEFGETCTGEVAGSSWVVKNLCSFFHTPDWVLGMICSVNVLCIAERCIASCTHKSWHFWVAFHEP